MKWIRCMSLATVASLGLASVASAGLFGSSDNSCSTTKACGKVSCSTGGKKKSNIFDCLFGKKDSGCADSCAPKPVCKPSCNAPVSCAPKPKRGLFDCFKSNKRACGDSCAPKPVCKPSCKAPVSCAPKRKRGLFDCFKSKKPACGDSCAPKPVCKPVCKPTCAAPVSCAPKKGGLFDCFKKKKPACGTTCAPRCAPQQGHGRIHYKSAPRQHYHQPGQQHKPAEKSKKSDRKPKAKPMPKAPAEENPKSAYYPSRVGTPAPSASRESRLGELYGAPN